MNRSDFNRVADDVQRLQQTLGLDQTIDRPHGHALLALSGLLSLAWTWLLPARWHFVGLLSILIPVAYLVALRLKHRASLGGSPTVRREFAGALGVLALGIPVLIYTLWARYLGIEPMLVLATVLFFVGAMVVGGGLKQAVMLCWGMALMGGALVMPLDLVSPIAAIALALIAGGSVSFLIASHVNRRTT